MRRIWILLMIGAMTLGGCATYYRVTDPTSGKHYYSRNQPPRVNRGGTVRFMDAKSGAEVTLTSSEVKKISKNSRLAPASPRDFDFVRHRQLIGYPTIFSVHTRGTQETCPVSVFTPVPKHPRRTRSTRPTEN